jgi:hypothetical protein
MKSKVSIENVTLDQLHEFLERGSMDNAPEKLVEYVQMLDKVRGMILRFDIYGNKEGVIAHLESFEGLSKYKAHQVYNEAIEYFYVDSGVSKSAWSNLYADRIEKAANAGFLIAQNVSDFKKCVEMLKEAAAMRQLHVPDAEEIPENFYDKPIKLLTYDPKIFEFGEANRIGLEKFIDALPELTEKQKNRIKEEALILPLKIFPNEQENAR